MNVIGARARGWWRDPDRAVHDLIERLQDFADATGDSVTVVFDREPADAPDRAGQPAGGEPSLQVVYAPLGGNADDEIVRLVEGDPHPATLRVVTSDRELTERVRAHGAEVAGAGTFGRRLD
jgi:predicted RNA-binding protein with PIN domain